MQLVTLAMQQYNLTGTEAEQLFELLGGPPPLWLAVADFGQPSAVGSYWCTVVVGDRRYTRRLIWRAESQAWTEDGVTKYHRQVTHYMRMPRAALPTPSADATEDTGLVRGAVTENGAVRGSETSTRKGVLL